MEIAANLTRAGSCKRRPVAQRPPALSLGWRVPDSNFRKPNSHCETSEAIHLSSPARAGDPVRRGFRFNALWAICTVQQAADGRLYVETNDGAPAAEFIWSRTARSSLRTASKFLSRRERPASTVAGTSRRDHGYR